MFDVASRDDGLPAGEQARLAAWFDSLGLGYGDHVTIDEPVGYASARPARDIAKVAAEYGLLRRRGRRADDRGPGSARASSASSPAARTASVPGCPEWSDPGIESPTRTGTNYGCAMNSNLAAMIANPDDLILGREAVGQRRPRSSPAARSASIARHRPTGQQPLPTNSTTGR